MIPTPSLPFLGMCSWIDGSHYLLRYREDYGISVFLGEYQEFSFEHEKFVMHIWYFNAVTGLAVERII